MGEQNPQVSYKPVHKNPMDKNRSPTDTLYLYIFAVILAAWFITNCIYLFGGNTIHIEKYDSFLLKILKGQAIRSLPEMYKQSGVGLIIWIALSGSVVFLLFLKTLDCLPKFWTIIGVIVSALGVAGLIIRIFMDIVDAFSSHNSPNIVAPFIYSNIKGWIQIIYLIACLHATFTVVKIDGLTEIIRKTSHAIFFFPTVFVFGFIIMILSFTVIAFTAVSLSSMDSLLCIVFSLLGGMYLIAVIYNFGVIVIAQCVSTWYWSQNKEELSGFIILKSIGLVGRNHIGSIAFTSTIFLPVILSIYVLCTNKFPHPPNSSFKAFLVKLGLIGYSSDYALTLTASHGLGIHEATKKVYSLFTRSCAIVLSFCCIFGAITAVFLMIAMLISMGVAIATFQNYRISTENIEATAVMYYTLGIYLFVAVFVTAVVAANTVLVNTTEEMEENEEREMNQIHGNA
jgi:hypothetical protein